jgi:SAM-dependent methyltransferase
MTLRTPTALRVPVPYHTADFGLSRHGIANDPEADVYLAADGTLAVLHPRPVMDYTSYLPRVESLGLSSYKDTLAVIERRFRKIGDLFTNGGTVLEVGARDGSFLRHLQMHRPLARLLAVEPDERTHDLRASIGLAGQYAWLRDAITAGVRADLVCLFHVFEHVSEPAAFLAEVRQVLAPGGRVVIEVPSLDDPLLSLYRSSAYEAFYFQRQHPYVYSARSLSRVLTANELSVSEIRPYQRYGLENHLAWLMYGRPGGDARFAAIFAGLDEAYRAALEASGQTDTVIAVATAPCLSANR